MHPHTRLILESLRTLNAAISELPRSILGKYRADDCLLSAKQITDALSPTTEVRDALGHVINGRQYVEDPSREQPPMPKAGRCVELQSGALAEANANREHLRQQLRAEVFVSPEKRTTVTTPGDLFEGCDMGAPLHEVAALIARTHEQKMERVRARLHPGLGLGPELTPAEALAIINANREPGPIVEVRDQAHRDSISPSGGKMFNADRPPLGDYNAKVSTAASDKP